MTQFNPDHPFSKGYDAPQNPKDCRHCHGTEMAPSGDGRTKCGFCDRRVPKQ